MLVDTQLKWNGPPIYPMLNCATGEMPLGKLWKNVKIYSKWVGKKWIQIPYVSIDRGSDRCQHWIEHSLVCHLNMWWAILRRSLPSKTWSVFLVMLYSVCIDAYVLWPVPQTHKRWCAYNEIKSNLWKWRTLFTKHHFFEKLPQCWIYWTESVWQAGNKSLQAIIKT